MSQSPPSWRFFSASLRKQDEALVWDVKLPLRDPRSTNTRSVRSLTRVIRRVDRDRIISRARAKCTFTSNLSGTHRAKTSLKSSGATPNCRRCTRFSQTSRRVWSSCVSNSIIARKDETILISSARTRFRGVFDVSNIVCPVLGNHRKRVGPQRERVPSWRLSHETARKKYRKITMHY